MLGDIRQQLEGLGFKSLDPSKTFKARLKRFDWTWEYSDQFLKAASDEQKALKKILKEKRCPFSWQQLFAWAHNMIFEDFEDTSDGLGTFYKKGRDRRGIAPCARSELITREEFEAIDSWLDKVG